MRVGVFANPYIPEIHLFCDRRKFKRFCKRRFGEFKDLCTCGQTYYVNGVAAVLIDPPKGGDIASTFALIAHESYHVACFHFERLGVTEYDDEIMAYSVQVISGSLCVAYMEWRDKAGMAAV